MEKDSGIRLRKILVPIDFSPLSETALTEALALVEEFGSELHLVYVAGPEYPLGISTVEPAHLPAGKANVLSALMKTRLREFAGRTTMAVPRNHLHALRGRPFVEICRLAGEVECDLIVIATHGWTGLKHLLLGSTAERVVRHADCPVLVVRGQRQAKTKRGFKRILAPVDFPKSSARGLSYATAFARQFGAEITLVHSVDLRFLASSEGYMLSEYPVAVQAAEEIAREQMDALRQGTDWGGLAVKAILETGHPGDRICRCAEKLGADLIIIPTHGYTGLKHVFLGSTAEYVVRHASTSVLVVPARERAATG